ncbi:MAG: hypothetical protein WDZ37_03830 [Solirubrobacterales bacterium]
MSAALDALRDVVEGEGPPLADALVEPAGPEGLWGSLVAAGKRAQARRAQYALLTESIYEGYLLHYLQGRLIDTDDGDLLLLGGDFLYAYGLTRLAALDDVDAIADFADLIALCAQLHAPGSDGRPDRELAGALWALTSLAVGSGRWPEYEHARELVRIGDPEAARHVPEAALARAREVGLERELEQALIAFRVAFSGASRTT